MTLTDPRPVTAVRTSFPLLSSVLLYCSRSSPTPYTLSHGPTVGARGIKLIESSTLKPEPCESVLPTNYEAGRGDADGVAVGGVRYSVAVTVADSVSETDGVTQRTETTLYLWCHTPHTSKV